MKKKIWNFCAISDTAVTLKYPQLKLHKNIDKIINLLKYINEYSIPLEFNVNSMGEYLGYVYSSQLDYRSQLDVRDVVSRVIDEAKIFDKQVFGVPTDPVEGIDSKIANNFQVLGFEESYNERRNIREAEHVLEVLGKVKYHNRSAREEVPDIRAALSRVPTNVLVFSREFKNELYMHAYMNELKRHNASIIAVK